MNDGTNKSREDQNTNYDGDDPEVPVVLPHSTGEEHYAKEQKYSAHNYVKPAFDWMWGLIRWVFTNGTLWTVLATIVIAVATCMYTYYSLKQLPELRKSADAAKNAATAAQSAADTAEKSFELARRHAEDTDEALCNAGWNPEQGTNMQTLQIFNQGVAVAHKLRAHVVFSLNKMPDNTVIKTLKVIDINRDELRRDKPIAQGIVLSGVKEDIWNRIDSLQETIQMKFSLDYENGFDSLRHVEGCQVIVWHPAVGLNSGIFTVPDCSQLALTLHNYTEQERRALQNQKH